MNNSNFSRFNRSVLCVSSAILGLLPVLMAGEAKAASFTFRPVADTRNQFLTPSTQYTSIDNGLGTSGSASLLWGNSDVYNLSTDPMYQAGKGIAAKGGKVAFIADKTASGQTYQVISLGNPNTASAGATPIYVADTKSTSPFASFGQGIALRSIPGTQAKEVAFVAKMRGTNETKIFVVGSAPGSVPREVASSTQYGEFAPGLSMNDAGEVAFTAKGSNGITNVYKAQPPATSAGSSVVTSMTGCTPGSASNQVCSVKFEAPSINNAGKVSFTTQDGVFVSDSSGISPIVSNDPMFILGSYREANINNSGLVSAFTAVGGDKTVIIGSGNVQGQVIFTGDGSDGSVIAGTYYNYDPAGEIVPLQETFYTLGTSSLNNNGNVAFMGKSYQPNFWYDTPGIFVGSDSVQDKVIALGDSLLGSTVTALSMDRGSLTDDGEISFWARLANNQEGVFMAVSNVVGASQFNPWLPNCPIQTANSMSFCGVTTGHWFDPPTAYGFDYEMDSDSLFTSILDLPATFENPFTVSVADKVLGVFGSGDSLNFGDYADLLGDLLIDNNGTKGVTKFTVRTGDAIDPTNPMALPIKLAFNTETADFSLYAIEPTSNPTKVPEPATIMGFLVIGAFLVGSKPRRQP
ncbi:PEP-CTERM sorting domain-containing protein [Kamptonema formosum]|uniref:PEP-CTERM sorting domain-containing protein n=1 Tax=Kamptonema formosum TaxID=331992 RepID=UPI00036D1230|nr:PEP-CTERM sorting domain-containing protein [Oscillatoria sp. PCC 10802]